MRRITLAAVSTLAVLILLFSYKTSRPAMVATAQSTPAARIVSGGPASSSGSASSGGPAAAASSDGPAAAAPAVTGGGVPPAVAPTQVTVPTQPAAGKGPTSIPPATAPTPTAPAAPSTGPAPIPAAAPTSKAPVAAAPLVVDGAAVDTDYGPVQVRVTISGGRITDVSTPVYPQESGHDQRINAAAIPQLQSEALAAQGSRIDAVSGATYTTQGFVSSLQSALDAAHFGS